MGIYLPMDLTLMIPVGALLGLAYDRWAERRENPETAKRLGVLLATGLIVGESLFAWPLPASWPCRAAIRPWRWSGAALRSPASSWAW
jgi:hypothetical protein